MFSRDLEFDIWILFFMPTKLLMQVLTEPPRNAEIEQDFPLNYCSHLRRSAFLTGHWKLRDESVLTCLPAGTYLVRKRKMPNLNVKWLGIWRRGHEAICVVGEGVEGEEQELGNCRIGGQGKTADC